MLKGIDTSKWNGDVDFAALINAGVKFVIMKATEGLNVVDKKLKRNRSVARQRGIIHGFYHFARRSEQSSYEADYFLAAVGPLKKGELLVLDYEVENDTIAVQWCKNFLDRVYAKTGVRPFLYVNFATLKALDWSPVAKAGYRLWLARYDYNPVITEDEQKAAVKNGWAQVSISQYTDRLVVNGANSPVDGNVFDGTEAELLSQGYHG
jgi:lysozyme